MNRFKSKKGFTLAELLIVVAIIAVLVAIAVPLFVGALDRAEKATIKANERSLKGMAVTMILSDDKLLYETGSTTYKEWYVSGEYDTETDKFTLDAKNVLTEKPENWREADPYLSKKDGTTYKLFVTVTASDLTDTRTP